MDSKDKFEILKWLFEKSEGELPPAVNRKRIACQYVPSDLTILREGFEQIITDGLIDSAGWVLDTGSADERVVALLSYIFGFHSLGIEYDRDVFRHG